MKKIKVMMRYALLSATAVLLALSAVSCLDNQGSNDMRIGRTVLIYIAADNNLAPFARQNLEDIKNGGLPQYFDEGSGDVLLVYADIRGETPKLMRLSSGRPGEVYEEVLMEYDQEQDSMSDSVMNAVLSYADALFPSDYRGLVLWSHGTGWLPEGFYSNPVEDSDGGIVPMQLAEDPFAAYVKSCGSDGSSEMDIRDLAEALPVHYSYILFDACLMGGVEVAYELREKCDYLVASAAEVLAAGFPYDLVVEDIVDGSLPALKSMCDKYYEYYREDGATVAVVDTKALDGLATACREVLGDGGRDSIQLLDMDSLQGYYRLNKHWFYDLEDFMTSISPDEERTESFRQALDAAVVYKKATDAFVLGGYVQFDIKTFSGLSTYVPNPENSVLDKYYRTLAWNKAVTMVE